uniref:Uncharacterized protein n=1 Tax=Callorhinchus milii TaxID=7868 RepID=A0A4W3GSI7_CALMI
MRVVVCVWGARGGGDGTEVLLRAPHPDVSPISHSYFSQILEEHGPLALDDPLLVSEFENFPGETQELVCKAGGLMSFLLESLRFVMMKGMVGLMKHAVMMKSTAAYQEPSEAPSDPPRTVAHLNPAAKEFKPISSQQSQVAFPLTTYSLTDEENFNRHYSTDQGTDTSTDNVYYSINAYSDLKPGVLKPHSSIYKPNTSCPEVDHYLISSTSLPGTDSSFCVLSTSRSSPVLPVFAIGHDISNYNYVFDSLDHRGELGSGSYDDGTGPLPTSGDDASLINLFEGTFAPPGANPCVSKRTKGGGEESNSSSNQTKNGCKPRPLLRTIGVQVYQESSSHVKVNTDPFQPFENQQGDILRIEKEHNVLQKQLREAEEKYKQLSVRSLEEVSALEAEVAQHVQRNELLKSDLQCFRQAAESEAKRGQLERRENQESLKLLKSRSKELAKMNEMYSQNIEEKIQLCEKCVEEFEEISIQSSVEKIKLEDATKKNHQPCQNITKRATEAEVSVLQNWQRVGLFFHHKAVEDAKSHLNRMKTMASSNLSSAIPQLHVSLAAWETFLLQVSIQIQQTENRFEDQIKAVNGGIPLGSLNPVFIPSLPSGPANTLLFDKPPIDDPAIIHYSSSSSTVPFHMQQMSMSHIQAQTSAFPQASSSSASSTSLMNLLNVPPASPKAPGPTNPTHQTLTPVPPLAKPMPCVFNEGTGKAWPDLLPGFQPQLLQRPSPWSPVSQQRGMPGVPESGAKLPGILTDPQPAHDACGKPQPHKNSFEKIMDCLLGMFPHYTRRVLTEFICEVRRVNDGSLSGLAYEECIARVTELILNQQAQFAASSHQQTSRPQSPRAPGTASPQPGSNAGHQTSRPSTPAGPNSPRAACSASQAWRSLHVHSASAWDKKDTGTALDEDPCIICHEDLSPENTCVLECKHHFHVLVSRCSLPSSPAAASVGVRGEHRSLTAVLPCCSFACGSLYLAPSFAAFKTFPLSSCFQPHTHTHTQPYGVLVRALASQARRPGFDSRAGRNLKQGSRNP